MRRTATRTRRFFPSPELLDTRTLPSTISVDLGPDQTVKARFQDLIPLSGTYQEHDVQSTGWVSALFIVRHADTGALVEDGGVRVDQANAAFSFSALQLAPGDYTVTVEVTDGSVKGQDQMNLTVESPDPTPPTPGTINVTLGPDQTVTAGFLDSIPLSGNYTECNVTTSGFVSALFTVRQADTGSLVEDGGAFVDQTSGEIDFAPVELVPGNYTVTVQVTDGSITGQATMNLTVVAPCPPQPPAAIYVGLGPDQTVTAGPFDPVPITGNYIEANFCTTGKVTAVFTVQQASNGSLVEVGGAMVNQNTGEIDFDVVQLAPGSYTVTVQVTDGSVTGQGQMNLTIIAPCTPPAGGTTGGQTGGTTGGQTGGTTGGQTGGTTGGQTGGTTGGQTGGTTGGQTGGNHKPGHGKPHRPVHTAPHRPVHTAPHRPVHTAPHKPVHGNPCKPIHVAMPHPQPPHRHMFLGNGGR